jgi:streptomycin 6-kinase
MLDVPDVVREKALSVGAEDWLDALPELVREIEADWGITVGEAFRFSTEAFVATASCADGSPAVVADRPGRGGDFAARRPRAPLAGGEGRARLPRGHRARCAPTEKLGRSLRPLPLQSRHEIRCRGAAMWRPAPHQVADGEKGAARSIFRE